MTEVDQLSVIDGAETEDEFWIFRFSILDWGKAGLKPMSKRILLLLLSSVLLTSIRTADAQQSGKVYRIGYLLPGFSAGSGALLAAFRQGMREFGYVEGKHYIIEARWAERVEGRLPALAGELVRLNVDLIVAAPTSPALAAHEASKTIPIVVAHMSDPVKAGLVANLARPGGNVTGMRSLQAELGGKRLELLKEAFPKISRVAVLGASIDPGSQQQLREMESARALGLDLQLLEWKRPNPDFQGLSRAISEMRAGGLITTANPWLLDYLPQILNLAKKTRLPAIYPDPVFVEAGGLMSYGSNWNFFHQRAAYFVDKIFRGTKSAELPIEQATKFEFVVNLKTAKAMNLTIPPQVLMDADRVIK